jgi:uncharacterized protein (DUF1778 family)
MSKSEKRRLTEFIAVRCTRAEKKLIERAAKASGMSVSAFARSAAVRRAEHVTGGAA